MLAGSFRIDDLAFRAGLTPARSPKGNSLVEEAIRKAAVLVEALEWIRQFRGRYVVIKLGGSTLDDRESVSSLLTDVIFMETVGMRPVIVHGGGKSISRAMAEAGIEPRFVHGRRYTDEATIEIVSNTLAGQLAEELVEMIRGQGAKSESISFLSTNCLMGERLQLIDDDGQPIDLGQVGQITDVDCEVIHEVHDRGVIPVIPSVALASDGSRLNVNADTAAAAVARHLKAEKLVFLSDVPGICTDKTDRDSLISHLSARRCRDLIADGTIESGMVPKVDAALEALEAGVGKIHIVDAGMQHSLLLEIYSDHGVGTEIVVET